MITEASTKSNSYEDVLDRLFPIAGSYVAAASVEETVIYGRIHKDNLDRYYQLLMQAVMEPAFKQDDLDRLKSDALNYLKNTLRYSSDEDLGKAVLYNTIFRGTPYGHLPAGNDRQREKHHGRGRAKFLPQILHSRQRGHWSGRRI